jgi:hypothetical protein
LQTATKSTDAMLGLSEPTRPVATLADLREIVSALPCLDGDDKDFLNMEDVQLEVRRVD